ncbi:MAG: aminotransferase class V-fold PLP-dependent enzyme [Bacteroidetes Order II. Incertae sedis bacterium]|nr:aminotransferase class V-fold PLP-dependent enzyme [Bacteroidetes Order II. bacterium]
MKRRDFFTHLGMGSALMASSGAWMPNTNQAILSLQSWEEVRKQFPLQGSRVYFNTGGIGAAPYSVIQAVQDALLRYQTLGEPGHDVFAATHAPLAGFLGCSPEDLALNRNATEGNSTIAFGLRLKPGDEVILDNEAHPGGAIPWMVLQKEFGIKVKVFTPSPTSISQNIKAVKALWTPKTKVVQISHVTSPSGIRMPVQEIGEWVREKDIWLHVDGAQSAGMFPFNLRDLQCDSFAASAHKWMLAPHGIGFLWIDPARRDRIIPTDVGAYSNGDYELPHTLSYHPTAQRYEAGTQDETKAAGLAAAIAFLNQLDMRQVANHGFGLARFLNQELRSLLPVEVLSPTNPLLASSITTFRPKAGDTGSLLTYLSKNGFRVRSVTEANLNAIRVSTHIYNSMEECIQLLQVIKAYWKA